MEALTNNTNQHNVCGNWAIIVLNFCRPQESLRCIASVDEAASTVGDVFFRKILVDNGSNSETVELLKLFVEENSEWELVTLQDNRGFGTGMNAGVALLEDGRYERVFFLNNDTLLATDTLRELVKHAAAHPDELITGVTVLGDDGEVRTMGGYRYFPWLGMARAVKKFYRQPEFRGLDYIDGAAFLVAGDFLGQIGGLPETNFLYFEELNLAAQLPDKSRIGFCPAASVFHQGGVTTHGQLPASSRHYHALLSCLRYTEEHESRWLLPSVLTTRLGWLLLLSIQTLSLAPIAGGLEAVHTFFYKR